MAGLGALILRALLATGGAVLLGGLAWLALQGEADAAGDEGPQTRSPRNEPIPPSPKQLEKVRNAMVAQMGSVAETSTTPPTAVSRRVTKPTRKDRVQPFSTSAEQLARLARGSALSPQQLLRYVAAAVETAEWEKAAPQPDNAEDWIRANLLYREPAAPQSDPARMHAEIHVESRHISQLTLRCPVRIGKLLPYLAGNPNAPKQASLVVTMRRRWRRPGELDLIQASLGLELKTTNQKQHKLLQRLHFQGRLGKWTRFVLWADGGRFTTFDRWDRRVDGELVRQTKTPTMQDRPMGAAAAKDGFRILARLKELLVIV